MTTAIVAGLLVFYGGGCYVIAKRTKRRYTGMGRWAIVLLWPIFVVGSGRFRKSLSD
ncbi:hypothetical protein [Synechococcus sp. PCC 7336]|uniref:hypothetical protein n=1 Tax=Synechococcus sp. PCC 7336 TaxID=195250 RepID=UPI00035F4B75|nr:hypothetical protein [Synechococcus sp. PCC 7336]